MTKVSNDLEELASQREVARDDLVAQAIRCRDTLKSRAEEYRRDVYEVLENVYRLALDFAANRKEWRRFLKEPFWEQCKKKKPSTDSGPEQVIFFVSRFVFRATRTKGRRYNRAYKHARVLQKFAREKVRPEDVAKKLEEKGEDDIFRRETKEHPRQAKQRRAEAAETLTKSVGSGQQRKKSAGVEVLEVLLTKEQLDTVLSLKPKQVARILVERGESAGGWVKIYARSVKVRQKTGKGSKET
jgi:hypothetical protein